MAKPQSDSPRYWIIKDSAENHIGPDDPPIKTAWILPPGHEIRPRDIVYLWRQEDSSYFYGWGIVEHQLSIENSEMVDVRHLLFPSPPVMRRDLALDADLEPLVPLIVDQDRDAIELNGRQAAALNRLIRNRGLEAPPDLIVDSQAETDDDDEEGEASETTLVQLMDQYSRRMSKLSLTILRQAGNFARQREFHHHKVTTSCVLFAASELGKISEGPIEDASQFTYHSMLVKQHYNQAIEAFLGDYSPESRPGTVVLSSNTLGVIEIASKIAPLVRKQTITKNRAFINARDLIGALIFHMAKNPGVGAAKRLRKMEVNLDEFRKNYVNQFLDHEKNPDDDIAKWRQVLIELSLEEPEPKAIKVSLPLIDADLPSLEDHLNITPEVTGFANIIASRGLKTPLSIGLFGDWGSGKSTFMEQLQATVENIAKEVREKTNGGETSFLGNIVQIKFNAWHYVDANLWASLVSNVFENLSFSEKEKKEEKEKAEKRKQLLLGKLAGALATQKVAEAEVKIKEANYESAKTALADVQQDQNQAEIRLSHVLSRGIWPIVQKFLNENPEAQTRLADARKALGKAELTTEELKREIDASRTTFGRLQRHLSMVANDPKRAWWLAGIILLPIAITSLLTYVVVRFLDMETVKSVVASVTPILTVIGAALAWFKTKRQAVDSVVSTLNDAGALLDDMHARAKGEYDSDVERLTQELSERQNEIITAKQAVQEANKEKEATLAALREMEPGRVLETFVQERAASEDYRKLLGVVALIRRDFKRLSEMLLDQDNKELTEAVKEILKKDKEERLAAEAAAGNGGGADAAPDIDDAVAPKSENQLVEEALKEYRIDRIVLYIDDLDRCPPKQVVNVLQAIHLLLAFELFVVVVGVDARWVRHALREEYPKMLGEDWDDGKPTQDDDERLANMATPRDYVEKIFQVPFWLKPMDDKGARKLLEGLIPESQLLPQVVAGGKAGAINQDGDSKKHTGETLDTTGDSGREQTQLPGQMEGTGGVTQQTSSKTGSTDGGGKPDGTAEETKLDLNPANLLLDSAERDAMIALSKVIGRTPRTLKRFVNVYRIIKAGLDARRLEAFMGSGPADAQYPAVLLLLAIAHGATEVAPAFFLKIQSANKQTNPGLKALFKQKSTHPATLDQSLKPAWSRLMQELKTVVSKHPSDIPLSTLNDWLPIVIRYTFQLGRFSDDMDNKGRPMATKAAARTKT